jgi:transposase
MSEQQSAVSTSEDSALAERVAVLEATLAAQQAAFASERTTHAQTIAQLTAERDLLRSSHERLRLELELIKRRIFVAKAERVDSTQLELEFAQKLAELDALAGTLGMGAQPSTDAPSKKKKSKPTGRRDLKQLPLEEVRVELTDPLFEKLVSEGKAERLGFEESCKLAWKRGGMRRLVVARTKYVALDARGEAMLETTPMPAETFARSLAAPSMLAHILVDKYCDGLPLNRIEQRFARDGVTIDRGTMCRWVEDAGATLGATVVTAARDDAMRTVFCIATDATGVAVQPIGTHEKKRQACKRGHYFVQIADKDHIFFEYTAQENSAAVSQMFRGFSGYVQADAKSVFDILYRPPDDAPLDGDAADVCREVACWSHARRGFWEATVAKCVIAREGLARIGRIFELDATWRDRAPAEIAALRNAHLRPHLDAFFAWAQLEHDKVRDQRGLLRSALGYTTRQQDGLMRFLEDGRLEMTNNRSERALRTIAVGRKAWLFVGSDDHAQSAAHIFSLIASARLHRLDPEAYLRDLLRVLAHWPRDRYLELAPKHWTATRARLDPAELDAEIGPLSIPPLTAAVAEQETAPR